MDIALFILELLVVLGCIIMGTSSMGLFNASSSWVPERALASWFHWVT